MNNNGNIVSDNLLDMCIFYKPVPIVSNGVTTTFDEDTCYISSTGVVSGDVRWFNVTPYVDYVLEPGTYTFSSNQELGALDLVFRFRGLVDIYLGRWNNYTYTYTFNVPTVILNIFFETPTINYNVNISDLALQIEKGSEKSDFEPFGTWYNENYVGDLSRGVIDIDSALLTYEDSGTGDTVNYGDVSSLIKNTFGTLYFDEVWKMLDIYAVDGYENAFIDIKFKNRFDITTKYIITTTKDNYGSGVIFYQDNVEMLSVLNLFNVKDQYCGGAPSYSCYVQLNNYVNVVQEGVNSSNAFSYLNRIKVWSDSVDMQTLTFGFENISYSQGYNSGYNVGYGVGNSYGQGVGYNQGYNQGYLYGYEKGVDAVEGTDNTLVGLVGGVLTAPVNMLQTIFDFEFLGINLTHFIFSIISLFIVIWLIKIFL